MMVHTYRRSENLREETHHERIYREHDESFESLGYFAKQRNRRGRQLGRVLATRSEEVVTDRLFDGTTILPKALQPLMQAAEQTLELDERRPERTLVRIDAGGGSLDDVNWRLPQGYQVHCKDYSSTRAQRLAQSVQYWVDDPHVQGRQVGWVRLPADEYVRPVRRIAVRCRKADGQWGIGVLISTLATSRGTGPDPGDDRARRRSCHGSADLRLPL